MGDFPPACNLIISINLVGIAFHFLLIFSLTVCVY